MEFALLDAIRPIADRIGKLDLERDLDAFATEILTQRPEAFAALDRDQSELAARGIARHVIPELKELPELANMLCERLAKELVPSVRLAMTVSLAYFVNPEDYLNDDLPACYGYVDDLAVLWAMLGTTVLVYNPASLRTRQTDGRPNFVDNAVATVRVCSMCIPPAISPALQRTMAELLAMIYSLQSVPEATVNERIRQLMANPYVPIELPRLDPHAAGASDSDIFALPGGNVVHGSDDTLAYQFDDGESLALR